MSTRAEALARLDAARRKVVTTLRAAGEEAEAGAYERLSPPGKAGWFRDYMFRFLQHGSMFQGAKLDIERVRNRAKRSKSLSVGMGEELTAMATAIEAAEEALLEFRGVFGEVVEEGFRPRGFVPEKPVKAVPVGRKVIPAPRRKASPS